MPTQGGERMSELESATVASLLESIPLEVWDKAVDDLEKNRGVATIDLGSVSQLAEIHAQSFLAARQVLDATKSDDSSVPHIPPDSDSGHVTGYHSAGGTNSLSRYNQYREGFIFSDGNTISLTLNNFEPSMKQFSASIHGIAHHVLLALERKLGLPESWFENELGATADASQWHVKRYVVENESGCETKAGKIAEEPLTKENGDSLPTILLPMHTDPSLIAVVIHDKPGTNPNGMGLQYQAKAPNVPVFEEVTAATTAPGSTNKVPKTDKIWKDVESHGHAVATIFTGSVLSYITGNIWPGVKHRVVQRGSSTNRMAATLFLRPKGSAMLSVPPSPKLQQDVRLKKQIDFHTWNSRVARNYTKKKNRVLVKKESAPSSDGYYKDAVTEMSTHACNPPLKGREKYLGGECATNGKIYAVPGHVSRVLVMDPTNGEDLALYHIGPEYPGEFKWLRAVRCPQSGILYAIPCHADSILRIDSTTDEVSTVSWDQNDPMAPPLGMLWKYHGGNISEHDGCLYCIPQRAKHIMKFDLATETVSFFGGPFEGTNKWYGGLVGPSDGAIYGINQCAAGVLRIDPHHQTATLHGDFPEGGYKWHGGVVTETHIYGIPAHASTVLKITPGPEPIVSEIGDSLRTGQHRTDGKYKYLGGAVGLDGCAYLFPSDADYVLQINPETDVVREVGPNLRDLEPIHHNKWQNGFTLPDGSIYAIPLKAKGILRIQTFTDGSEPIVSVVGGPYEGLNKWEGGVLSLDGRMFCMPLNCSSVLQIKPLIH